MAEPQPGPPGIEFLDYTPPRRFAAGARVGNIVYLAGETPRDPETGENVVGDIHQQTDLIFQNIERSLRAFGTDLAHVFKITVYLTDMANLPRCLRPAAATCHGRSRPRRSPSRASPCQSSWWRSTRWPWSPTRRRGPVGAHDGTEDGSRLQAGALGALVVLGCAPGASAAAAPATAAPAGTSAWRRRRRCHAEPARARHAAPCLGVAVAHVAAAGGR